MSEAELNKIEATLKECPCCTYQAVIEPYKARKGFECTIHCNNCMMSLTTITYDTEEEAIDAAVRMWNTRKPMERIVERLENMKLIRVEQCHEDYELELITEGHFDDAIEIVKGGGVDEVD